MELIKVFSVAGQLQAEIIKAFLEANGVKVFLNQESVGRTMGLSAGHLGQVRLLVPESQASEASDLITAMINGEFEDFKDMDIPDENIFSDSEEDQRENEG